MVLGGLQSTLCNFARLSSKTLKSSVSIFSGKTTPSFSYKALIISILLNGGVKSISQTSGFSLPLGWNLAMKLPLIMKHI